MKTLDFSPLVRLNGLCWDDVEYALGNYCINPANPVRPTLGDYHNLSMEITELLHAVPFSPQLFRLKDETLKVHLGAAGVIADTLDLAFSDTCINVLYERTLRDAQLRGAKMKDEWSIGILRERSEVLERIYDQFLVLASEEIHLDVQDQYVQYAFSLTDDDDAMVYEEFEASIVQSCLNVIQNVLLVESKVASAQFDGASR